MVTARAQVKTRGPITILANISNQVQSTIPAKQKDEGCIRNSNHNLTWVPSTIPPRRTIRVQFVVQPSCTTLRPFTQFPIKKTPRTNGQREGRKFRVAVNQQSALSPSQHAKSPRRPVPIPKRPAPSQNAQSPQRPDPIANRPVPSRSRFPDVPFGTFAGLTPDNRMQRWTTRCSLHVTPRHITKCALNIFSARGMCGSIVAFRLHVTFVDRLLALVFVAFLGPQRCPPWLGLVVGHSTGFWVSPCAPC